MTEGAEDSATPGWAIPVAGSPVVPVMAKPKAGWYPDPWAIRQHRYWNGETWTADAFPDGPAGPAVRGGRWLPQPESAPTEAPGDARWAPQAGPAAIETTGRLPGAASGGPGDTETTGRLPWAASGGPGDTETMGNLAWAPPAGPADTETLGPVPAPPVAPVTWSSPPTSPPPPPAWSPPSGGGPGGPWRPGPPAEPPPGAQKSSRMPSGRALAAILLVVGLVVGFVAMITTFYALGGNSKKSTASSAAPITPQQPFPTSPGTTTPAAPADPSASALSGLVLGQADVASPVIVARIPGGGQVSGEATLDLCNGTFPSESLRTARLQVAALDAQGNASLSTEAVLYSNPDATVQAFAELKATAAKCPASPVVSPVGEPTTTTHFNAAPDAAWPQTATVERAAFDFVATDQSGQAQHSIAVYLRRGRALMGVYFSQPDGPQIAVSGQTTIAGIVNLFATRMANLPASVVNG
jgi:hypothetical protein